MEQYVQGIPLFFEFSFFLILLVRSYNVCLSLSNLSHLVSQASSFIHVVTNGRISFFLVSEYCSIVRMFVCIIYIIRRYIYMYLTYFLIFFMHSSVDRHFSWLLWIMLQWTLECGYLFETMTSFVYYPEGAEERWLDHIKVLCLIFWKWSESENCSVVSNSLRLHGLYSPWNSPGQNTRVGSLSLLQGIFPTQGLSPGLPHGRRILYQLSHKGSLNFLRAFHTVFHSGHTNFIPINSV